ncbi:hypothetical protein [Alkalinema sp. FACHB-956]|uniref:hypothetical protein n=1 Tax=Alkalinema sp. FACHB-956 TaxID=2692768 RepID=UPI001682456C|nr:hypothetical protein [Alkalinema sp. FACHB-956]MBD2329793.1 hypothetical protein [Alkalinema sp. FACHB-956]
MTTTPLTHLQEFPCSSCGAKLEFNPKAGQLKCPYCGHEEAVPELPDGLQEIPFESFLAERKVKTVLLSDSALEVACPGCRARITFQPPDVAGKCPFCGTGIVGKGEKAHPVVEPGGVLPCKVTANQARDKIRKWLGNNWFVPNSLQEMAQQQGLQGVYLPFWTYDAQTHSSYTGQRGEYYYVTETRTYTNSEGETVTTSEQVRHTHWYSTSGYVSRSFDDVLIPATTQLPEKQLNRLTNWNLQQLVPYSPAFLAGFKAQRYQVSLESGLDRAKQKMQETIHQDVRHDIGGDEQHVDSVSTQHSEITFKHILLPVWLSAYRYNNKVFQVIVNAQTGQVMGERPYSATKIAIAVVAGVAVLVGGFFLFTRMTGPSHRSPSRTYRSTPTYRINRSSLPELPIDRASSPSNFLPQTTDF